MSVRRQEGLNVDSVLVGVNVFRKVVLGASVAGKFRLFDGDHDAVGKTEVDERVHASSELLEQLGFLDHVREVGENESVARGVGDS